MCLLLIRHLDILLHKSITHTFKLEFYLFSNFNRVKLGCTGLSFQNANAPISDRRSFLKIYCESNDIINSHIWWCKHSSILLWKLKTMSFVCTPLPASLRKITCVGLLDAGAGSPSLQAGYRKKINKNL